MKPIYQMKAASHRCRTSLQESTRSKPAQTLARRNSRLILALGVALCASSVTAQTVTTPEWKTVDDADATVAGVTADTLGNVFVTGSMKDASGVDHGVVSRSSAHTEAGETWVDYVSGTDAGASFSAIAAGEVITALGIEHHLVAVGSDKGGAAGGWIVRRSLDESSTWETLNRFNDGSPYYSPKAVALDDVGSIYVVGDARVKVKNSFVNRWLLRKGERAADGTINWRTLSSPYDGYAKGVVCVGTNVFVVGYGGNCWQVRKSTDGGITWTLVDNFRYDQRYASSAWGIAADHSGNLFVVGRATGVELGKIKEYGVVRKGGVAGTVWTTVDRFNYGGMRADLPPNPGSGFVWAAGISVDPVGKVHMVGSAPFPDSTVRQWFARQGSETSPGVWSWVTTEQFRLAYNYYATGQVIVADPAGNVYTAGQAADASGIGHSWIVRRKLAP